MDLRKKFAETFRDLCTRLYLTLQNETPAFLYALSVAAALMHVAGANSYAAFNNLLALLSGVGGGVIANRLSKEVDRDRLQELLGELLDKLKGKDVLAAAKEVEQALQQTPELRPATDVLLAQVDAETQAEKIFDENVSDEEQRAWFREAWQQALQQVGSRLHIEADIKTGDRAVVAVGHKAEAIQAETVLKVGRIEKVEIHSKTEQKPGKKPAGDKGDPESAYLQNLHTTCNLLPLSALAGERDRHAAARMTLSHVYIDLNTTERMDKKGRLIREEMQAKRREPDEETRPWPALAAAAQHDTLVLLGDPGSGKSSFVNHLLACLAQKRRDPNAALPAGWPHGALLPVRCLLRELAVRLQQEDAAALLEEPGEKRERRLANVVRQHLLDSLTDFDAADFAPGLRQALENRQCLLVFDGLDEAPAPLRELVRYAVESFCRHNPGNRFLITCRIRSYEGKARLQQVPAVSLAPFTAEQVDAFIARWYGSLAGLEAWPDARRKERIDSLQNAVRDLPKEMVQNPMLLTTMANVHAKNIELPKKRVKLYLEAAKVLLWRWQAEKEKGISLFDEIGLQDDSRLIPALRELGYVAQSLGRGDATADIPEGTAYEILKRHFAELPEPGTAADKFLARVDRTAGLLVSRGGETRTVLAFPHRTFQEYFAGCHMAKGGGDFAKEILLKLEAGDDWRLAAQLGAEELLYNDGNSRPVMDLVYHTLCPAQQPKAQNIPAWRGIYWASLFALEVGMKTIEQDDRRRGGGPAFLERLRKRLAKILEQGLLPAGERAEAGFALGRLGDPRPGVLSLPPLWVDLPGGRFLMGSKGGDDDERPLHEVELSPFKISKYPITNGQFRAFVDAGGYSEKKWWSEDGRRQKEKYGWEQPRISKDARFNLPNQPVVGVSWYEAEAFCNWLTATGECGKGMRARLPTEAEWEFAARGRESRPYPWGEDAPTPERANYDESGIDRPTAVGCYLRGATPERIFDLAGNVWEWCLDWYDSNYYAACKKRGIVKNPKGPEKGAWRAARGGSWFDYDGGLRAALRNNWSPGYWLSYWGFRVVLSAES